MSKVIRNGVIVYQSRKGQFGHMSLKQFMNELKKTHKSFNLKKVKEVK